MCIGGSAAGGKGGGGGGFNWQYLTTKNIVSISKTRVPLRVRSGGQKNHQTIHQKKNLTKKLIYIYVYIYIKMKKQKQI